MRAFLGNARACVPPGAFGILLPLEGHSSLGWGVESHLSSQVGKKVCMGIRQPLELEDPSVHVCVLVCVHVCAGGDWVELWSGEGWGRSLLRVVSEHSIRVFRVRYSRSITLSLVILGDWF